MLSFYSANRMFQPDGMESEWRIWTSKWPYQRLRFWIVLLSLSGQSNPLSKFHPTHYTGKKDLAAFTVFLSIRLFNGPPSSIRLWSNSSYHVIGSQALKDSRCYPADLVQDRSWLSLLSVTSSFSNDSYLDSFFLSKTFTVFFEKMLTQWENR